MQINNLKRIRVEEGLTITELALAAHVSTKVISQTERMLRNPTEVTKNKILKGLNAATNGSGRRDAYEDVFSEPVKVPLEDLFEFDCQ